MSDQDTVDPNCKFEAGFMMPVIDPERCEAKGPCVTACPYDVLAIRIVPQDIKDTLSLLGRIKLIVHGGKQAFVIHQDACHGCGLCVQVCPEDAIRLQRR